MKISGIICELNPPHNGHQYLVEETKKRTNCDFVIAIMSGDFVQRGTPAMYDYQTRAFMALNIGFDAVIYMPTVYSLSPANDFAKFSVQIANSLNLDYLSFGISKSEEEIGILYSILLCENNDFKKILSANLKKGISYATAFTQALENITNIHHISGDDILALQYMLHINSKITTLPIARHPKYSATKLRQHILSKDYTPIKTFVNESNYKIISDISPLNYTYYQTFLYHNLVTEKIKNFQKVKSIKEGLENRIIHALNTTTNYYDFNEKVKNKRYTQSFLNRLYSNILLGINNDIPIQLPYIKIISAKNNGILNYLKSNLPIVTTLKNKTILNEYSIYSIDTIASRIYNIITNNVRPPFPFHKITIHNI